MASSSEKADIQQIRTARDSLDALLPNDRQIEQHPGWPEIYPNLHTVYERPPRNRGGLAGFLVMKQLRLPEESYETARRSAGVGELPVNFTYLEKQSIDTMPSRLSVRDTEYTAVKAKYDWPPFRHTAARFITGVTASEWATSEYGMEFSFVEIGTGEDLKLSFQAAPFGTVDSIAQVTDFFNEHTIYQPRYGEASVAALGSLAACMAFAQQS